MRRVFALFAALILVAGLPAATSAARPFRETDHAINLSCDGLNATSGSGFAYFGASLSDLFGPDAFLDAWNGDEPIDAPDVSRDYEQPASVTWDGTTLAGSFPLLDSSGQAAGSATFSAELTPVGDPTDFNDSFRDGNQTFRFSGTSQTMQPTGTLTLPSGTTFDLANCFGDETTVSTTATNPNALIFRFSQRFVGCDLTNTDGDTGFIFVDLGEDLFVDAGVHPADGSADREAFGGGTSSGGAIDITLDVVDAKTGEPTGETGALAMTATSTGESFTNLLQNATNRRLTRGEILDIEGTLTVGAYAFDLGACVGVSAQSKEVITNPQGPKPGGKVPTNDLPSGAKLLKPGGTATVNTKGAALDAEAPFECESFPDPDTGEVFTIPINNTVWYKFTGTGSAMTIDTAGSDYDTVAALYTASGGAYVPVADGCVDDVPTPPLGRTLQASVTIPTVAGVTYYAQIGGFPESFPYGNLKVALR